MSIRDRLGITAHATVLDRLAGGLGPTVYPFMPMDEYEIRCRQSTALGMQVYWHEMLCRCHLAAATGILRQHRWLRGLEEAAATENGILFAAAFRGLVESSADIYYGLSPVPLTLAKNAVVIRKAVAGALDKIVVAGDLESRLIHYSHARTWRRHEPAPQVKHEAKATADYLKQLPSDVFPGARACYDELCNITHPAHSSVACFLQCLSTDGHLVLHPAGDATLVDELCQRHGHVLLPLLMYSLNPIVMILRVLNALDQPELRTPAADPVDLSGIPLWRKVAEALEAGRLVS